MTSESVRARIDEGHTTPLMWLVVILCFLLNMADGVDVVAMSVTAPSIAIDWQLDRIELGPLFSAALVGMAIGGAGLAPLSDQFGRRMLLIIATFMVGLSMIAVTWIATSESVIIFSAIRFVSGLGIGVIFGSTPALASEFMPSRLRSLAVSIVIMGYPIGAIMAGPIANALIPINGWESVFIAAGCLTLLMGVAIGIYLPESPEFLVTRAGHRPARQAEVNKLLLRIGRSPLDGIDAYVNPPSAIPLVRILSPNRRLNTLLLWVIYFMGFLAMYFMLSWIPTLFIDAGFSREQGIQALTGFNIGAIPGILAIAFLTTRIRLIPLLSTLFLAAGALLSYLGLFAPSELQLLMILMFIAGVLMHSGFTCLYALVAQVYPTEVRAAGIGWAAGLGRSGAIASPLLAAALLSAGWSMYALFLIFAVPLMVGGLMLLLLKAGD